MLPLQPAAAATLRPFFLFLLLPSYLGCGCPNQALSFGRLVLFLGASTDTDGSESTLSAESRQDKEAATKIADSSGGSRRQVGAPPRPAPTVTVLRRAPRRAPRLASLPHQLPSPPPAQLLPPRNVQRLPFAPATHRRVCHKPAVSASASAGALVVLKQTAS